MRVSLFPKDQDGSIAERQPQSASSHAYLRQQQGPPPPGCTETDCKHHSVGAMSPAAADPAEGLRRQAAQQNVAVVPAHYSKAAAVAAAMQVAQRSPQAAHAPASGSAPPVKSDVQHRRCQQSSLWMPCGGTAPGAAAGSLDGWARKGRQNDTLYVGAAAGPQLVVCGCCGVDPGADETRQKGCR